MAKAKAKVASDSQVLLNRWAIEMALRWPTVTEYSAAGVYSHGLPGGINRQMDCDVIGRANKIIAWVKEHH